MATQILEILYTEEYWYNKQMHIVSHAYFLGQYRAFRNKAVSMICIPKRHFNSQRISQAADDSKQLWRIVNEVTGKKKEKVFFPPQSMQTLLKTRRRISLLLLQHSPLNYHY